VSLGVLAAIKNNSQDLLRAYFVVCTKRSKGLARLQHA